MIITSSNPVKLVDQILAVKQRDPAADTRARERQIDQIVYALYTASRTRRSRWWRGTPEKAS
jgi:hypothetical protein